jgi:Uma2 family endonuclease
MYSISREEYGGPVVLQTDDNRLTVQAVDEAPDDGLRRELIDGILVVTPAPAGPHQRVVTQLAALLVPACSPELEVLVAPFDYRPDEYTDLQPDVLVVDTSEADKDRTAIPPKLVVEVLSSSTRNYDLGTKRLAYEHLRVPAYWLIGPATPELIVLRLIEGTYEEVYRGKEAYEADWPFRVKVDVTKLIRRQVRRSRQPRR